MWPGTNFLVASGANVREWIQQLKDLVGAHTYPKCHAFPPPRTGQFMLSFPSSMAVYPKLAEQYAGELVNNQWLSAEGEELNRTRHLMTTAARRNGTHDRSKI